MEYLLKGIQFGLLLAILVGPLVFALLQASIEQGVRAGTAVGLGIWVSDFLFIVSVYWCLSYIQQMVSWEYFEVSLGIGGSIILAIFGLGMLLSRVDPLDFDDNSSRKAYGKLWLKGFLINTINPFTVVFWLGLISTTLIQEGASANEMFLFLGGILGTIIVTDFTKVILAKQIRQFLKPVHVLWLRKISGSVLLIFGIGILLQVFFNFSFL